MTSTFKTLSLTLSHRIRPHEIGRWRGAFLEMAGWEEELLHNHDNKDVKGEKVFSSETLARNKVHYRYPLIQYYEDQGRGTIVGINEGVNALLRILDEEDLIIRWNGRMKALKVVKVAQNEHQFGILDQPKQYRLKNWMALTQRNHQVWKSCDGLTQRILLLDKLLTNHIIGVLKELNWRWPPGSLQANLDFLYKMDSVRHKGVKLEVFDVAFSTNINLPVGLSIGKGVSHGFGIIIPGK